MWLWRVAGFGVFGCIVGFGWVSLSVACDCAFTCGMHVVCVGLLICCYYVVVLLCWDGLLLLIMLGFTCKHLFCISVV